MRNLMLSITVLLLTVNAAFAQDLSSVRHQRSGRGHYFLSTHQAARVGDREVSISLYLLPDRYVAVYTESKRKSASESEVLVQQELAGAVSGGTIANLGRARVLAHKVNGKPVVELVLDRAIGASPAGLTVQLAWTYGSWAPRSVQ